MAQATSLPNPSQSTQILKYLQAGNRLTPQDALRKFSCFRLAARVSDLRRDGYEIHTERKKVISSDGTQAVVAEYWMEAQS